MTTSVIIFNDRLHKVLMEMYLDQKWGTYHGNWALYLVVNGYMDEHMAMVLRSDEQVNRLLSQARKQAQVILDSELMILLRKRQSDTTDE